MMYEYCRVCGCTASQKHHVVFRSENKALEHSKVNIIPLCESCHYKIHHGNTKEGKQINILLKIKLQDYINFMLPCEVERDDIRRVMRISDKMVDRIVKTLRMDNKGKYEKDEVIKRLMGGRFYFWNEYEQLYNKTKKRIKVKYWDEF